MLLVQVKAYLADPSAFAGSAPAAEAAPQAAAAAAPEAKKVEEEEEEEEDEDMGMLHFLRSVLLSL